MSNIVITGAARGIAFELTRQCAEAGDRVFATCRDPSKAGPLKELAAGSGGRITVHAMDVTSDESVRSCAAEVGDASIDVLYNIAGIVGPYAPELEVGSSDWGAWNDVINTLTYGPLRVLQAFLPKMHAGSKIINLSSQVGASTWTRGALYPYAAAKAALNRLMRGVAFDLKDRGIIVGLVHPGLVSTDMGGPNAPVTPHDSASGIRKLTQDWTMENTGAFYRWNGEVHPW